MEKRTLGRTGIALSEIGYGAAALFGKNVLGKQGITEEAAYELFSAAHDRGVNFFDTGINYGYSEERLGRCIERALGEGASRGDFVVETKCGETIREDGSFGPSDWSPDWIKKSLEISLTRLKLEYIDLFAMHGGRIEDCSDALIHTFEDMRSQGLIRAFGINTFDTDVIQWIAQEKCFDYVMLDYNVMKQEREPQIRALYEQGVGVIAGMALGQSLFSRKMLRVKNRNDVWYLLRAMVRFRANLKRSRDFRFLAEQKEFTGSQLALRYVLDNPGVTSGVFSTTNMDHLMENLKAAEIRMPDTVRRQIQARA